MKFYRETRVGHFAEGSKSPQSCLTIKNVKKYDSFIVRHEWGNFAEGPFVKILRMISRVSPFLPSGLLTSAYPAGRSARAC